MTAIIAVATPLDGVPRTPVLPVTLSLSRPSVYSNFRVPLVVIRLLPSVRESKDIDPSVHGMPHLGPRQDLLYSRNVQTIHAQTAH